MSEYNHTIAKLDGHGALMDLEPHFDKHMMAMTAEDLHSKGDIAAELAYRDKRIEELEAKLKEAQHDRAAHAEESIELRSKLERLEKAGREMAELLTPAWSDFVGLETLEVDAGIAHECVAKFMSLVGEQ